MYCKKCGKEMDESWVTCPYCQTNVEQSETNVNPEVYEGENIEEGDEDKVLFKTLFQKHPIRFCLCIPIWVFVIYKILNISMNDGIYIITQALGFIFLGTACSWCLYGPINLREVKRIVDKKDVKSLGILPFILCCVLSIVLMSCGAEEDVSQAERQEEEHSGETNSQGNKNEEEFTIEDYVENCTVVELEALARNPEEYIGKHIIVEGDFMVIFDAISIIDWEAGGASFDVEYDGVAYDENLNEVGNVLNADSGYVAGEFLGNETIRAVIVIVK